MKRLLVLSLLLVPSLARGDEAKAKQALERFQTDRDVKALVAAIGTDEYPSAEKTLEAMLGTDDHDDHVAALDALGALQGRFEETVYPRLEIAADPHAECRLATVAEIVRVSRSSVRGTYAKVMAGVLVEYMGSPLEKVSAGASVALSVVLDKPVVASDAKAAALLYEEVFKEKPDPEAAKKAKTESRRIRVAAEVELQTLLKNADDALKRLRVAGTRDAVARACADLEALEKALRAQGERGVKNAEAFEIRLSALRGKILADLRAAEVKKNLVVTAIVVDPRPESRSRAIIHYEGTPAIYEERSNVVDREGKKVEGLVVEKIAEGVVTFRLDDHAKFDVELKKPGGE